MVRDAVRLWSNFIRLHALALRTAQFELTVMKRLLYAGVVGPLLFIAVFLLEGATRPGYNPWRMYVSQLATGPGGWVQVVNFLVCGTLVIAFAIGMRMAIAGTRGSIGTPVLL